MSYDTNIDVEALRRDLLNEVRAGAFSGLGGMFIDSFDIERASEHELISLARSYGLSLNKYLL